jgi:hypothetical protein
MLSISLSDIRHCDEKNRRGRGGGPKMGFNWNCIKIIFAKYHGGKREKMGTIHINIG